MDDIPVAIECSGVEHQFAIEDITAELLMDSFELKIEPKALYQCPSNLVIPSKKWQSHLKPGCSYYIKNNCVTSEDKKLKDDESLGEIILHSLVASTAVYHINHAKRNDECEIFLKEQLENHNFEYVIQSQYGENIYIMAKESNENRIYVSFCGTKDLSDWKYNVQVFDFYNMDNTTKNF